ncbi:MAG: NAD(P)-dependent oxidoreductase [Ruminococcus sp.]
MKIVILEADSLGQDMVFTPFEALGEVVIYRSTTADEMEEKTKDADVIVANKVPICESTIGKAQNLKLVCLTATGFNNLDGDYLKKRGIAAYNVCRILYKRSGTAYLRSSFLCSGKTELLRQLRKIRRICRGTCFSHFGQNFFELDGKTWGIIGLGAIGNKVAQIAKAFGCHIICYSASGKKYNTEYEQVSLDELLSCSDILSVHAPLNGYTENLMTLEKFRKMKKSAIFLNLARGAIVNEPDLYTALTEGSIAGAGLDVLCKEPMDPENPLLKIQDSNKLIITPHIAWAAKETRFRVVDEVVKNIQRFQRDDRTNRVY